MQSQRRNLIVIAILGAAFAAGVVLFLARGGGALLSGPAVAIVVVAVAVVTGAVVLIATVVRRRGRHAGISPTEMAAQFDLTYQAKAESAFHQQFGKLPGIPSGRGGKVEHVFVGRIAGRLITAFQHLYITMAGQTPVPVYHTVLVLATRPWPALTVRRRGALGRLFYRMGVRRGLQLENEAFNLGMRVTTADPDFAVLILGPEMQRFLLDSPAVTWHIDHGRVAAISNGRMRFDRIGDSLDRMRRFWDLVPSELEAW